MSSLAGRNGSRRAVPDGGRVRRRGRAAHHAAREHAVRGRRGGVVRAARLARQDAAHALTAPLIIGLYEFLVDFYFVL